MVNANGSVVRKQNVLAVDHPQQGIYRVRLPAERAVRFETHHIGLTMIGTPEQLRTGHVTEAAGSSIEIRTFNREGVAADASFMLAAERL